MRAIDEAVALVEKHAMHGAEIGRVRRRDRWNFPPAAVRESIANAVAHADYLQQGAPIRLAMFEDRMEIENPGFVPFGLTIDDLALGVSKLRNRVIGRVFHELGLVEQWGSGAQRMIAACEDSGLASPTWEEVGWRLRVTIHTEQIGAATADPTDKAIIELLNNEDELSTSETAASNGISPRHAYSFGENGARGLVRGIRTGSQDPQRRYFESRWFITGEADIRRSGSVTEEQYPGDERSHSPLVFLL